MAMEQYNTSNKSRFSKYYLSRNMLTYHQRFNNTVVLLNVSNKFISAGYLIKNMNVGTNQEKFL